jgi:hypothetical protein
MKTTTRRTARIVAVLVSALAALAIAAPLANAKGRGPVHDHRLADGRRNAQVRRAGLAVVPDCEGLERTPSLSRIVRSVEGPRRRGPSATEGRIA